MLLLSFTFCGFEVNELRKDIRGESEVNHYEVLGVAVDASPDEIKKAWHKVARVTHSDTASGSGADHLFKAAEQAYSVLRDPESRRAYDASLRETSSSGSPGNGYSDAPASSTHTTTHATDESPSWGEESSWGEDASGQGAGKQSYSPFESTPPPPPSGAPFDGSSRERQEVSLANDGKASAASVSRKRHRHVLSVPVALLIAGVTLFLTFPLVSAEFNIWGSTFLVVAITAIGLAIVDGEGLRDWKLWAWMIMGAWTMNRHEGGFVENWPTVVFFLVPALVTVIAVWRDGPAPAGRPQRWTWGRGKRNPVAAKAR